MKRTLENLFLLALAAASLYAVRGDLSYYYRGRETYQTKAKEVRAEDLATYAHARVKGRIDGARTLALTDDRGREALLFPFEAPGDVGDILYVYTRDPKLLADAKTEEGAVALLGDVTVEGRVYPTRGGRVRLPGVKLDLAEAYRAAQGREVAGDAYVLLDGAPQATARELARPGVILAAFAALLLVRRRAARSEAAA